VNVSSKRRRGSAAVEFATLAPVLVLFLLGAWEVGRLVQVSQLLSNAVREGGRQASTGQKSAAQVQAIVVEYLQQNGLPNVTAANVTVTNLSSGADPTAANQLDGFEISVSVPFNSVRWVVLNQVTSVQTIDSSAYWVSMRDIPVTVNTAIPLN
jgi:Flp pilus assembly protein TadG